LARGELQLTATQWCTGEAATSLGSGLRWHSVLGAEEHGGKKSSTIERWGVEKWRITLLRLGAAMDKGGGETMGGRMWGGGTVGIRAVAVRQGKATGRG
jgi:hypothetical protein